MQFFEPTNLSPNLAQRYQKLRQHVQCLIRSYSLDSHDPKVVAALSCVGLEEGSILSTMGKSPHCDDALYLGMLLSLVKANLAQQQCPQTRRHLLSVTDSLEEAISLH